MATPASPRPAPRTAWAGDSPHRGAARERLLQAAGRCVVRDGLQATSLSSVAAEAGVSRPTVYRYFADRHALLRATAHEASRSLSRDLAEYLRAFRDPARMVVEAHLFVRRELPQRPLLEAFWRSAALDAALLADVTRADAVRIAREALDRLVRAAGWSEAEATERIEWMLRVLLTFMVAPGPPRSEDALRDLLNRYLVPSLGVAKAAAETSGKGRGEA